MLAHVLLAILAAASICVADENIELDKQCKDAIEHQQYEKAISIATQMLNGTTNCANAYYWRGCALLRLNKLGEAITNIDAFIQMSTKPIPLSNAYQVRAYAYLLENNPEKAIEDCSLSIQHNPSNALVYVDRAEIYNRLGKYDLSFVDCNMAILLSPEYPAAFKQRGDSFKGKHSYGEAVKNYSIAIENGDNDSSLYYSRAQALFGLKEYKRAIADFDKFIQCNPSVAEGYASRGYVLSLAGKYKLGIDDCKKAIAINTNAIEGYNNLAWLLATAPDPKLRDGNMALTCAKKACELSGWKVSCALGTLAAAYAETGNYAEAIKWQEKQIELGVEAQDKENAYKYLSLYKSGRPYHASADDQ
jgi:tetratricopeptide (TPR) repeat protein